MSYRDFEYCFNEILARNPLPNSDQWYFQRLGNKSLEDKEDWMEMLYRTCTSYQCKYGHYWESAWTMILFRFHLDRSKYSGRVRMKQFAQRCAKCPQDRDQRYLGFCHWMQVLEMIECLLFNILQRFYHGISDPDDDTSYYIIPIDGVVVKARRRGRFGGPPHARHCCEACARNRCQEKFKELTKKK